MTFDVAAIAALVGVGCALAAACLSIHYLVRRPAFDGQAKLWLFLALGPLSIGAGVATNVANREAMRERRFCGSCHAMDPFAVDAADAESSTLVARHSRNPWIGARSCSSCHDEYDMLKTSATRIGALAHFSAQHTDEWAPGHRRPHVRAPFPNAACLKCHSQAFAMAEQHRLHGPGIVMEGISCVSGGCHGPAHVAPAHERLGGP